MNASCLQTPNDIRIKLLMSEEVSPFLTVTVAKRADSRQDDINPMLEPPSAILAKKRKSKVLTNRKTNEDLIQQTHDQLMKYVDSVDSRVQTLIQNHESDFLSAYRVHVKKVREEMELMKRQSMKNASSQQVHLDKIDILEKELAVFRNESLKLYMKLEGKDKEIAELNIKLKELRSQTAHGKKSIYMLARKNKELEAIIEGMRQKYGDGLPLPQNNQSKAESKALEPGFVSKEQFEGYQSKQLNTQRPFTSAYGLHSKTLSLRMQSNQKSQQNITINDLKQKLQEQVGQSKMINVDTVLQMLTESSRERKGLATYRERLNSKASKRSNSFRMIDREQTKLRSEELAQKMDYLAIFKNCVDQIKKDVIRRNQIPSINFFKENGPKNLVEFKKTENYRLLQLFLRNQEVLKTFYTLLFGKQETTPRF